MSQLSIAKRRKARFLTVQVLYQWQLGGSEIVAIQKEFERFNNMAKVDTDYFKTLIYQIPKEQATLDQALEKYADRQVDQMNPVDLQILRIAAYELQHVHEIPYKVAINEALDLAKTFGSDESRKYINGILNAIAEEWRSTEKSS